MDTLQKTCPKCSVVFETIYPEKVYCSKRCRRAFVERNRRTRNRKAECKKCGVAMPLRFGRGVHQVCDACRFIKPIRKHKSCLKCGEEIGGQEKKYCRQCAKKVLLEQIRENTKKYFKTDKGKASQKMSVSKYFKTPKGLEYMRRFVHKRNAKMKLLPHDLTEEDWNDALEYFDHKCVYCRESEKLTQDHFTPVSKGGGYTRSNIVPACKSCNCSKHNTEPCVWLARKNNIWAYRKVIRYFQGNQ